MTAPVPNEIAQAARSVFWPIRVTGTESGNFIGYATANDNMRRALRGVMPVVERADDALTTVCLCHPLAFRPTAGHRNFLFTMFESAQVPDEFDSAFGRADVLVVPTTYCKRIFRAMPSAPKRIEVCPLGIETDLFRYRRRRPKPGRPFRWLMVCAPNPRKWSIFEDAFGYLRQRYGNDVELYVKTTACAVQRGADDMVKAGLGDGFAIDRTPAGEIIRGVGRNAGWIIDNRRLPREELAAIYYEADGFMALHMGEGFGLTPLEAQATGLPVVVTGATGTDDFCTPETAFRVEAFEGEIPCESRDGHRTMIWGVEPKIESAVAQLVAVMEDPHRAAVVGKRAAENAARYTWRNAAMRLRDIVLRS